MNINRPTPITDNSFNLMAAKQVRPTDLLEAPEIIPKTKAITSTGSFYKVMASLLVLIGGCREVANEKKEVNQLQKDIVINRLDPPQKSLPSKKKYDIDRKLSETKKDLFKNNLLLTLDKLSDLYNDAYRVGKGVPTQMLMGERLESEIFPVLWNHVFVAHPDKVIVAEFSEPGEFASGSDFGRGLRLVLRKKVGDLNISTILFLDYNEKTKKLEFPTDFYFHNGLVPDVMRTLIEYDIPPMEEELRGHSKDSAYHVNSGFFGTTISASVDSKTHRVRGLHVYPTRNAEDKAPLGIDGQGLAVTSLLSCIGGCHDHNEGKRDSFAATFTSFADFQESIHLPHHQKSVIKDFLKYVSKKRFDSPEEKTEVLTDLEKTLRFPKENLSRLLPLGFSETLEK